MSTPQTPRDDGSAGGRDTTAGRKRALRERLRAARGERGPAALEAVAAGLRDQALAWPPVAEAGCVAAYLGVGGEPGTLPLVEALHARGTRVLLPVVLPDLDLDWAPYAGQDRLVAGRRGLLEPDTPRLGTAGIALADVVLAPATAVDTEGHRLGQGGGCYDRALTRIAARTVVAALVHDDELLPRVPRAEHDRRVDAALTPTRTVALGAG